MVRRMMMTKTHENEEEEHEHIDDDEENEVGDDNEGGKWNSQQLALDSELPGNKQARLASKKGFWCPKQPSLCWPIPIIVRRRILRILLSDGGSYIIVWRRMSDENVRRMEKDISTSFVFHELQCRGYKNWRLTHNLRVTKNSESFSTAPLI